HRTLSGFPPFPTRRSSDLLAVSAMRVVAEVDVDLGLTRVVWIGTAQDVGHAVNPLAVVGQIEGGAAQGLGLALMEELQTRDGHIDRKSTRLNSSHDQVSYA